MARLGWRVRGPVGLLLIAAAVLAGCSGTAEPPPGESPEHAHEPGQVSASPAARQATSPAQPAQASRRSAEGARAFALHYLRQVDYAYASGDTGGLERVSAPDCTTCQGIIGSIRSVYDSGGAVRGGGTTVTEAKVGGAVRSGVAEVDVQFDSAAYQELDESGAVVYEEPARRRQGVFVELRWAGGRWQVQHIADR